MSSDSPRGKAFQKALGLLVSAILIGLVAFFADWGDVMQALQGLEYIYLVPILILYVVHFVLRALRWNYLLPGDPVRIRTLFDSIMIGNFASFILPLRAGEFIRPFMLSKESEYKFSIGFISVVVERFFDLIAVLFTFAVLVVVVEQMPDEVFLGAWALGGLAFAIFLFMVVGSFLPGAVLKLVKFFTQFLPSGLGDALFKLSSDLLEGAAVLKDPRRSIMVVFYTGIVWGTCYLSFYLFFLLFHLPASWEFATTLAVITALAVAMPSAPGFVGVYQTACMLTFPLFGVDASVGLAYSLVSHALQYVLFIGYGVYILYDRGMSFADLRVSGTPSEA
jgi:uncharacterized protein (TIRG00374 family)